MHTLRYFFRYSFAVSVLHALHAVYDVDAGRQVVPLLGQLYAVKVVDALLAGGHVDCNGADAVVVRLNHHLVGDNLVVEQHGVRLCIELSTVGLGDGAAVKNEVFKVADRTLAASYLNVCVANSEHITRFLKYLSGDSPFSFRIQLDTFNSERRGQKYSTITTTLQSESTRTTNGGCFGYRNCLSSSIYRR